MSLHQLLGTWEFTMRHVALPQPIAGRQHYERVLDGAFLMLRSYYDHPEFPDAIALLEERRFNYFDVRGVSRLFDLTIDESGWSMIRRDEDFWQRSAAHFVSPDAMEGTGENSFDGGATWVHDFSISYARVGGPSSRLSGDDAPARG